jgi:hypothetical protein
MQEITYKKTGQRARGRVTRYKHGLRENDLSKGAGQRDIACLKPAQQRKALLQEGDGFASRFTIGFEVEKNELHRDALKEHTLFARLETDASCGYEAITHILPLLPAGTWRNKVFDLMHQAEVIIDDRYSRSDEKNYHGFYKCGGHTSIGVVGMSGEEIRKALRPHCGIILSVFRKRLMNQYCGHNKRMQGSGEPNMVGGWHHKYQTALVKTHTLEFRLVAKFESVKQMMRRYQLFHEVVDFAINTPNGTHAALMKRVRPILMAMYENDDTKVDRVVEMAGHFRKFILDGTKHESIKKFTDTCI